MYDINIDNVKQGKRSLYTFLLVAFFLLILFGGFYIYHSLKLKSLNSVTLSTSVELNTDRNDENEIMYSPIYYYVVDGVTYSCASNSSSNVSPGTSNRNVYYDSSDPSKCMTEYSKTSNTISLVVIFLLVIYILFIFVKLIGFDIRINTINKLNKTGKLVKNLPYRLEPAGVIINKSKLMRPVVSYTSPDGLMMRLYGEPRYDGNSGDMDGSADIVIDEHNPKRYFVDFEINRLTGNMDSDFSNGSQDNNTVSNNNNNML